MKKKIVGYPGMSSIGMYDNSIQNTNFGFNQPKNWSIKKPSNEFDTAIVTLLNQIRFNYMYNHKYNILLIYKNKIVQVGAADNYGNTITITKDTDKIHYDDVIGRSHIINGNYVGTIAIKLDPDAEIFSLSPKAMEKLQSKTLMPLKIHFDNSFIRLSNESLDTYMISEGLCYKLSEEASKEVISIFNGQEEFNKGDE